MTDAPIEVTLDDEVAPALVPENGVAQPLPPKEPKPEPAHRRRAPKREDMREPVRAHEPPRDFADGHDLHHPGRELRDKDVWPTTWRELWTQIVEWVPTQTISDRVATLDDIVLAPTRVQGGGHAGGAVDYEPMYGNEVAGNDSESPAVALYRAMVTRYHLDACIDPRARAQWKLKFSWRLGGKSQIKECEPFWLPPKAEILARASNEPGASPIVAAAAAATNPGGKDYYHGRLEEKVAALEREAEQARKENRAPRPVEQVMQPSVGAMPADWQARLDLEKRVAVAEAEKRWLEEKNALLAGHAAKIAELENSLRSLETKSKDDSIAARIQALQDRIEHPPPPPQHEVEARYLAQLASRGVITIGADGQPAPVKSVIEGLTLEQAIAQIIQDPATYAKLQASYQSYRDRIRSVHGLEEPRTEIVPSEPDEPEAPKGVLGMAKDWLGKNGDVLLAMGLEGVDQAAGSVLMPGPASAVKNVIAMGKEQLKRKAEGPAARQGAPPPGWKPPSV